MATILVVDDRASNRQFLLTLLNYSGHTLLEAADGAEALRLIRSARPDLVITDILMPTMDGCELVDRLRGDPQVGATPVIFYTATFSAPQAGRLGAAFGVRTVLPKPSDPEVILAAVDRELSRVGGDAPAGVVHDIVAAGTPRARTSDIALTAYLRDLQIVKEEFDDIAQPRVAPQSGLDHRTDLARRFSDSASRLQRVTSRLSALIEVGFAMNWGRDPGGLVRLFFGAACDMISSRIAAVAMLDEDECTLCHVVAKGVDAESLVKGGRATAPLLHSLLTQRRTLRLKMDADEAQELADARSRAGWILAMSVASPERIYGWIYFADRIGTPEFTEEDERLAGIMSTELALRYEHAMLYEVIQRHAASLQLEMAERKRAEQARQESEGRFRQLAESIREVFWLTDIAKNEILYVSPAYEEIWGRSVRNLFDSPRDWLQAIHPDDRGRVLEAASTRQVRGDYEEEYRIVRPDGSLRWIRDRAFPVRGAGGEVIRLAGVAEDITERKRADDALRESERRFSDMLRNVQLVSLMLDTRGCITYCNDYLLRLTGWSREEISGGNWFELFVPSEAAEDVKGTFASLLADVPSAWHHENWIATRSGSRLLIQWNNTVLRSPSGEAIGTASIGEDVTERRKMAQAAIEAERRYRSIFENAANGIVQSTLEGTLTSSNQAGARILGYESPDQLLTGIGKIDADLYVSPDDRQKIVALLQAHGVIRGFETRFRRRGGEVIWVSLSATLETDERDATSYILGMFEDVTERRLQAQRIERLSRTYAVLSGINAAIVRLKNRDELFQECCRIVVEAGRFALGCVRVTGTREDLLCAAAAGAGAEAPAGAGSSPALAPVSLAGHAPAALAVRQKGAVFVNAVDSEVDDRHRGAYRDLGIRSVAALPLLVDGAIVGTLDVHSSEPGYFDDQEIRLLLELAGDVSFALANIQRAEQLQYLALFDALTGLANRTLFLDRFGQRLHRAAPKGERIAVVLIDIERLRTVNDSLGRHAGDAVLKQFAERLKMGASHDESARLSADHFAVFFDAIEGDADVVARAGKLWPTCVGTSFIVEGGAELRLAARGGIALFPQDGTDAETLLRNAEAALRRAKQTGDRYLFHSAEMTAQSLERLSLENSLRRALECDEFILHYQPKVDLQTRSMVGLEALIRWQSADHGLVLPGRFIPLLEETGLILEVGAWALRRAVQDHRRLALQGLALPRIAVNVSSIQLRQRDFVDVVKQAIAQGPLPTCLDLEITETMIMEDVADNTTRIRALRDLGVEVAIDDFGTGYSSLAYLTRLPVNALKIDRAFIEAMVDEPDTMALVSTIVSLAHSLRLAVVAEGVETEEQAKILRLLRCDHAQGYLFGRPLPLEQLVTLARLPGPTAD